MGLEVFIRCFVVRVITKATTPNCAANRGILTDRSGSTAESRPGHVAHTLFSIGETKSTVHVSNRARCLTDAKQCLFDVAAALLSAVEPQVIHFMHLNLPHPPRSPVPRTDLFHKGSTSRFSRDAGNETKPLCFVKIKPEQRTVH